MPDNLQANIQQVHFLTEQESFSLKKSIHNRPMCIPYKVDNTVHFLTPSVKDDNHHIRVQYGNKNEKKQKKGVKKFFSWHNQEKKTKLKKFFINPGNSLTKKTLSDKGENVQLVNLQDHSVFLISYKHFIFERLKKIIKDLPAQVKDLSEDVFNELENHAINLGNTSKKEFIDLKNNINGFQTQWNIYREKNPVKKAGKQFYSELQDLYQNIKHEIQNIKNEINLSSWEEEETEPQSREEKFASNGYERIVQHAACKIFEEFDIQTGMIYYLYNKKLYCIYQGDDRYLKARDKLIETMNQQVLARQHRNTNDSSIKNQNTHARNQRGTHIRFLKKFLVVLAIASLIAGLSVAGAFFLSPFIGIALIPVLMISSIALYKVCRKAEIVSEINVSQNAQAITVNPRSISTPCNITHSLSVPSHNTPTINNPKNKLNESQKTIRPKC